MRGPYHGRGRGGRGSQGGGGDGGTWEAGSYRSRSNSRERSMEYQSEDGRGGGRGGRSRGGGYRGRGGVESGNAKQKHERDRDPQVTFDNQPFHPSVPGASRPRFGELEQSHTSMLNPRYTNSGTDPLQGGGIGQGHRGPPEPCYDNQDGRGFPNQRQGTSFDNRQFHPTGQGQGPTGSRPVPGSSQAPFHSSFGSALGPRMGPVAPGPRQFGPSQGFGAFGGLMEPPQNRLLPGVHVSTPRFPDPIVRPQVPPANDVEIVVLEKGQQTYAEMVERNVREMGLSVDVMFPNDNIKLHEFIVSLSRNGTHFAVVIGPENEAHGSVTTHILRGTVNPEEHRNMPLRECYKLISSKRNEIKEKKLGQTSSQEHISLVGAIEEGLFLSDYDYKEILGAIHKKWIRQRTLDQRVDFDEGTSINTPNELQDRILRILGVHPPGPPTPLYFADTTKPNFNPTGISTPGTTFGTQQSGSNINFTPRNNQVGIGIGLSPGSSRIF